MNKQLEQVIRIQAIDKGIGKLEERIRKIPEAINKLYTECNSAKEQIESVKKEIETENKQKKALEIEVENEKGHLSKTKAKLTDVKTNKEYTALLTEIDNIGIKINKLEDNELELMELVEDKQKGIPHKEVELKEEERKFAEVKQEKEAELERLEKELEQEKEARNTITSTLDDDALHQYNNIAEVRGEGAVVKLIDDICQGCHMEVPPQFAIEVRKSEEIHTCPQCGRILWFEKIPQPAG